MAEDKKKLFDERLDRYQAAIALEPTDRIPIAAGSNYFAEVYSGNTNQETIYDPDKWLQAELAFCGEFPEVDVLRDNRIWGPLFDAVGLRTYKLPGRELSPRDQFQFVEAEYMKADEYDQLIRSPIEFMFDRWLPRVLGEFEQKGSMRSYMAFLKGGMAQSAMGQIMRNRTMVLESEMGMPQPMAGFFLAPFDVLADGMRGLTGALMDCYRQPEKVIAACDVLVDEMANLALATADPLKRWPIFVPTHKACFLSPEQFDTLYWPSFKKVMERLIGAGHTIRAYLEGDWGRHWHHMLELPKGKVLCDIDNEGDIFKAKKEIGHHQCLAGGIRDHQFILGTPEEMRGQVKLLCETVGRGGGFIISGGCNFPYTTKPENFRAMIDAVMEYGVYDSAVTPHAKSAPAGEIKGFGYPKVVTPWEVKKAELGGVMGDESLIAKPWERLESMAYVWLWQWVL
jgi:uroporphyrinogen-III decarboxylase